MNATLSPTDSRSAAPDTASGVPGAANMARFVDGVDSADGPSPTAERLCHLFRASLRVGRIHPLYLPILKYRYSRLDR